MESTIALMIAVVLGYRAKQRGRDGLKFGGGVAAILFGTAAVFGFWDQAVGVNPVYWWVIALFTAVMAWLRLNDPPAAGRQQPSSAPPEPIAAAPDPARVAAAVAAPTEARESAAPKRGVAEELADGIAWARQHKWKAAWRGVLILWGGAWIIYMTSRAVGAVFSFVEPETAGQRLQVERQAPISAAAAPANTQPSFPLDKDGEPIITFTPGEPVLNCVSVKHRGRPWKRIQLRKDGVYLYKGEADGWGRFRWEGDDVLHMTADEDEMWVKWTIQSREGKSFEMTNQFDLRIHCTRS